jgi:response regulator RpfG family c-di-GMP phosphodiesterase
MSDKKWKSIIVDDSVAMSILVTELLYRNDLSYDVITFKDFDKAFEYIKSINPNKKVLAFFDYYIDNDIATDLLKKLTSSIKYDSFIVGILSSKNPTDKDINDVLKCGGRFWIKKSKNIESDLKGLFLNLDSLSNRTLTFFSNI